MITMQQVFDASVAGLKAQEYRRAVRLLSVISDAGVCVGLSDNGDRCAVAHAAAALTDWSCSVGSCDSGSNALLVAAGEDPEGDGMFQKFLGRLRRAHDNPDVGMEKRLHDVQVTYGLDNPAGGY